MPGEIGYYLESYRILDNRKEATRRITRKNTLPKVHVSGYRFEDFKYLKPERASKMK